MPQRTKSTLEATMGGLSRTRTTAAVRDERALESAAIKALFEDLDQDGDMKLELAELRLLGEKLGNPELMGTDEQLRDAMNEMSTDGDQVITFEEFVDWWHSVPAETELKLKGKKHLKKLKKRNAQERKVLAEKAKQVVAKRMMEARALVATLDRQFEDEPHKICVMVRVKRVWNVDLPSECFSVMLHVVTCWLAEGDAESDAVTPEWEAQQPPDAFFWDADPAETDWAPQWRPKIAVRKLTEGSSNLEGSGSEDFFQRAYIDGRTLITWEAEKICTIGTLFDLRNYPVDVQALDILLELKTPVVETKFVAFPSQELLLRFGSAIKVSASAERGEYVQKLARRYPQRFRVRPPPPRARSPAALCYIPSAEL